MKFDARALQILKNFSTINQSMIFKPGNEIRTISIGPNRNRSVIGRAKLNTQIDGTFAIYDLGNFLSAISHFKELPELTITDHHMIIGDDNENYHYTFCEPSLIMSAPEKEIQLPSVEVSLTLKSETLNSVFKGMGNVGAPEIAFIGDGTNIYLQAIDTKDSTKSNYRIKVGETDKTFRFVFLAENMKILTGEYEVSMCAKGISHFKADDVEYWVAMEATSTYNS